MLSVIPYLTRGFGVSKPGESIDTKQRISIIPFNRRQTKYYRLLELLLSRAIPHSESYVIAG